MITLNDASRDAAADGLLAGLAGQTCHLYGGAVPADASEPAGAPIATGTTGSWEAHSGDSGAALAAPFTLVGTAAAGSGTVATYFRLVGGAGEVLQGVIGEDLLANNPRVSEGQVIRVTGLTTVMPAAGAPGATGLGVLQGITGSGSGSVGITGAGAGILPALQGAGEEGAAVDWEMDEHLPGGLTLLTDTSWPVVTPSGWGEAVREGAPQSIITDPSAPTGGTSVLRQDWDGVPDGQSPHFCFISPNTVREFGSIVLRLDAAFDVPGEMKWLTWLPAPGANFIWFGFYRGGATYGVQGAPASQINVRYVHRGQAGGDRVSRFGVAGSETPVPKGAWFKFSYLLDYTNQQVQAWLNSTLVIDMQRDGMLVNSGGVPGGTPQAFSFGTTTATGEMQQGSTWGGGNGGPAGSNIVIDHARTAIWRAT